MDLETNEPQQKSKLQLFGKKGRVSFTWGFGCLLVSSDLFFFLKPNNPSEHTSLRKQHYHHAVYPAEYRAERPFRQCLITFSLCSVELVIQKDN